jgi:lysozyme
VPAARKKTTAKKRPSFTKRAKKRHSGFWKLAVAVLFLLLLSPFYYGYVIKNVTSGWRWVRDIGKNADYRTYKSFDIRIPTKYKIHGIDVSSYQGRIDWRKVKLMKEDSVHISFAFIKATEGVLLVDPYFQRNWREANKAGLTCGAYHYFRPKLDGKWQARFLLQNVKIEKGNLPLAVDIEELDGVSPEKMRGGLADFLKEITTKTKVKPVIYTGLKFYSDNLVGYYNDYPLWIAHYSQPETNSGKDEYWRFWQHSDKAKVNGVYRTVDFNVFNGDSIAFKRLLVP